MDDASLIADIFSLFPMVRYAAIWDNNEKICGGMRENLKSYFSTEDEKTSIHRQIQGWIDDNNEHNLLGSKQYHLTVKEKARLYMIGLRKNHFLMISTEPDVMGDGLINSILELKNLSETKL